MFERFRTGTQSQQIQIVVVALCAIVLALAAIWAVFLRTPYQTLFSDLRVEDASAIVAELGRKKIPYRLGNGGSEILVPADMVDGARLDAMSEDGLAHGTVGFELFNKSDMGLTDFAQRINYQRALQGELARTILTFDGVESVRVHLSLGEDRIFRDDQVAPKASITIRMKKSAVLTEAAADGIRRMVAAAVPRLEATNVVVLNEYGQSVAVGEVSAAPGMSDPGSEEKRAVENFYEARIRNAISGVEPTIGVKVAIAPDLIDGPAGHQRLAEWSLKTRDFPLQITILSTAALSSDSQENIHSLALKAVAASEPLLDFISFKVQPLAAANHIQARGFSPVGTDRKMPVPDGGWTDMPAWLLAGASILLLLGGVFVIRRLLRPKRLSKRGQQDFAARLRAALNEGGGSVAPL